MDDTGLGEVTSIDHPWGKEEIFADVEGRFVGKVLHVRSGARLALQLHLDVEEVLSLMTGGVELDIGEDADSLTKVVLVPGQTVSIPPGTVHRISATQDSMLLEVSRSAQGPT